MGNLQDTQSFPRISEDGSGVQNTMVIEPKLICSGNFDKQKTAWCMPIFVVELRKLKFSDFQFLNAHKTALFLTKKIVHEWCLFQKS